MFQEKLIFEPNKLKDDFSFDYFDNCEEINYHPDSKSRINALKFTAPNSKGVVFYHHGNTGSLKNWGEISETFLPLNYDLLIYDYRTYGKSTGKLSEKNLYNDAGFIYSQLKKNYSEDNIVLYGRSIGSGIAARIASQFSPRTLILETPYYSLKDLVKKIHPFVPIFILRYNFRTDLIYHKIKCPVYIFHGTNDEVTYYGSSLKLQNLFKPTDELITLENLGHNGIRHTEIYKSKLNEILA